MSRPPTEPKIYHITHVDNLPNIIQARGLRSDSVMIAQGGPVTTIGMSKIKQRRLKEIEVYCHQDTMVGEYVPFYFGPRSVMLYILYRADDPDLGYRGGQSKIVHLEADLNETIAWAEQQKRLWAFSLSNAGAYYVQFRNQRAQLNQINWEAVAARNWSSPPIKEGKQAEFLLHEFFPWSLVRRIGVHSRAVAQQVHEALHQGAQHTPTVEVLTQDWYY